MNRRLENFDALIIGGSSGIGMATASRFSREGARVAVTSRDHAALGRSIAASGLPLSPFVCDVRDAESAGVLARELESWSSGLDVLFVNAGISRPKPSSEITPAFFDEHNDTNFKGAFFVAQALIPHLKDGASVIFTTSCLDQMGRPGMAVYAATKAAVRSLVRTLAAELAPRSIRVNAIAPGPIDSGIHDKMGLAPEAVATMKARSAEQIPLRRLGTVDEIAGAVAFLASPDAAFITGHELVADGGLSSI